MATTTSPTDGFTPSDRPDSFGHHFILGLSGPALDRSDKELLKTIRPAGVMLLKRNFLAGVDGSPKPYGAWCDALRTLLSEAQKYSEREHFIVAIDHEGGRVNRMPPPISNFPYARYYAPRVREVAGVMARELAAAGINVIFGPVADIHSNPANPVIGERAFGADVDQVTTSAIGYLDEMRAQKLLPCPKHFPGHGDTQKDSHLELPFVERDLTELRDRELRPFRSIIEHGVPMIMTAHILFPKIDPRYPATLSEIILKKVLREELGFSGVVVSDDLDMRAVQSLMLQPDGISAVLNATCDLMVVSRHLEPTSLHPLTMAKTLGTALIRRLISEETLTASYQRIHHLVTEQLSPSSVREIPSQELHVHHQLADEITRELAPPPPPVSASGT